MPMVSCSAVAPVLETAVCRVFDGLVHARARSHHENDPCEHGDCCLLASVGMRGAVDGVMSIAAPVELCAQLAAAQMNACGDGDADVAELAVSVLAEIASMSAGCVATTLQPVETTWLTPPAVTNSSSQEWDVLRVARNTAVLDVEGRQVLVSADVTER